MTPTTVTNDNGSFSPALRWERSNGNGPVTYVTSDFAFKKEDSAIEVAQQHLRKIEAMIARTLAEAHYRAKPA